MKRLLTGVAALTLTLAFARGAAYAQINDGTSFEHEKEDGMWGYYKEIKVVIAQQTPLLLYIVYNVGTNGVILKVDASDKSNTDALSVSYKDNQVETKFPIVGSQQFSERISDVQVISGSTLVSFGEGKMVKIAGTGGGGHNMFAIVPDGSGGFRSVPGYNYFQGDAHFGSRVVLVRPAGASTFIGLADGSLLKVKGAGGTGHNMFALAKDKHGWTRWKPNVATSYEGDQRLNAKVTAILPVFLQGKLDVTLLAFDDGRILKVLGTGGTGHNMFNVTADDQGFHTTDSKYKAHRIGDSYVRAAYKGVTSYATTMIRFASNTETIIGFSGGRMMRVKGTGGRGHNMFNVLADYRPGFRTWSNKWAASLIGTQYFPGHRINNVVATSAGVLVAVEDFDDSDTSGPQQHTHQLIFLNTALKGMNMLAVTETGRLGGKPCNRDSGFPESENCTGVYAATGGFSNFRQSDVSGRATPVDVLEAGDLLFYGFNVNEDDSRNNAHAKTTLKLTRRQTSDLKVLSHHPIPDPDW